jgi:H+/gluconate symporter-like permease
MSLAVILFALGLLIFAAYRGASVILFAPVAALLALILTNPEACLWSEWSDSLSSTSLFSCSGRLSAS